MFSSLVLKQVAEVFDISGRRKASQEGTHDLKNSLLPEIRHVLFTYTNAFEELAASVCRV
jgi:hypothetical protein